MSQHSSVTVHSGSVGQFAAYIYALYSPEFSCCYIGQTYYQYGAIGRLSQHLSQKPGNTFIKRICECFGYDEVILGKVEFFAVPLEKREEFWSKGRDYREAVEWLVQQAMISNTNVGKFKVGFIARVNPNNYKNLNFVIAESDRINMILTKWLTEMVSSDN